MGGGVRGVGGVSVSVCEGRGGGVWGVWVWVCEGRGEVCVGGEGGVCVRACVCVSVCLPPPPLSPALLKVTCCRWWKSC